MFSYVVRRILLFFPTVLGATLLVYGLMYVSPTKITDSLLPPGGEMRPEAREEKEAYINERFGLKDPFFVQYFRWLNNASPVGIGVWRYNDPLVVEQRKERREWRAVKEKELVAADPKLRGNELRDALDAAEVEAGVEFKPRPGQFRVPNTLIDFGGGDEQAAAPTTAPSTMPSPPPAAAVPLVKGSDLGYSFVWQRPSIDLIKERLPITLLLNALSIPLALAVSIFTGAWSARHRGKWQDWGTGTVLLALYSVPVIWAGVMAIGFFANVQYVKWFPPGELTGLSAAEQPYFPMYAADGGGGAFRAGYLLDMSWHLALPVLCLTYGQFAYLSKLTRTSMLETLSSDYVRTARAKGVSAATVLWRHAFRNAVGPIITVLAGLLPAIVAGSVVVETIFTINGMGSLFIESLKRGDRELFLSLTLVTLILTVVSYLIADLAYAAADPRVSYE